MHSQPPLWVLRGSEAPGSEAPGSEAPGSEAPGSEAPGSEAPGSEAPVPSAGIVLNDMPSPFDLGVVMGGADEAEGSTYLLAVRLNTMPTEVVTVTITGEGAPADDPDVDTFTFTTTNWNDDQEVTITLGAPILADVDEDEASVTFTAEDGGYDGVGAEFTWTLGNFTSADPDDVEADGGVRTLAVTWEAPDTRRTVAKYIVQTQKGSAPVAVRRVY